MSLITLNAAVIVPVRDALYSSLAESADRLAAALVLADRESTARVRVAYMSLCSVGCLLDRAGWHAQGAQALTLENAGEARLICDALERELAVEADKASDAREHGEHAAVKDAERRCVALYDALCALKAAASSLDEEGAGDA